MAGAQRPEVEVEVSRVDRKPVLLLVEDTAVVRAIVRTTLALDLPGLEILEARNGVEAIDLLRREAVDVVLTDLRMPGVGGVEFVASLRAEFGATLPIVVMSGDRLAAVEAAKFCRAGLLLKPFTRSALASVVAEAMCGVAGAPAGLTGT